MVKLEALRPKLREIQKEQRNFLKRREADEKAGRKPEPLEKIKLYGKDFVNEVFNIRVLDPAMGSGHFLVEAVDFIQRKLLDFLNAFPNNPVNYHLENTRETILKEMEDQGCSIDVGKLIDVNLMKRHILKRCIFGVDINHMAVELAKVSLWLDCFTLGAPLSFLDHHLRCGNSLIGARVDEARDFFEKGQQSLFGTPFEGVKMAVNLMRQIGFLPDVTSRDVSDSRKSYKEATDKLAPYKRLLDIYTSRWFGNESVKTGRKIGDIKEPAKELIQHKEINAWLRDPDKIDLKGSEKKAAVTSQFASKQYHFFHWELEFPEVFYGSRGGKLERLDGAGFDAVIGNPPYIGFHGFNEQKEYLKKVFISANGKFDIYLPFIEHSVSVLKEGGIFSYICPANFIKRDHGRRIRELLLKTIRILEICDFKDEQIFEEALNYTGIFIFQNSRSESGWKFIYRERKLTSTPILYSQNKLTDDVWVIRDEQAEKIVEKVKKQCSDTLEDIVYGISEGIVTGKNEVFIFHEEELNSGHFEKELFKKCLKGRKIRKYSVDEIEDWIFYPYISENNKTKVIPEKSLKKHVKTYAYLLAKKHDLSGREYFCKRRSKSEAGGVVKV